MIGDVLWEPDPEAVARSAIGRFTTVAAERAGRTFGSYDDLWRWSVEDLEGFWAAVWDFCEIQAVEPYERVLASRAMPGARWFPGARLNYAAHALRHDGAEPAIVARSQTRGPVELSWADLRDQVARARAGLARLGVGAGDRVAGYVPNVPEAIVAHLAAASLGAAWTSCAPEFGTQAVLDRFSQVEPSVLVAVDGYRYGERVVDRRAEVERIRSALPSLRATVVLPYLDPAARLPGPGAFTWDELVAEPGELAFEPVPADHPLAILYSSGTTGLPKAIVHGHGGILVEHSKVLGLHHDLGSGDRFAWFTTTGWMMWNYLLSGLVVGSTIVLFDGDPNHPGPDALWAFAAETGVTFLGLGAPYIHACRAAGLRPGAVHDLSALRAIGSTGAPLAPAGFRWVYEAVKPDVHLSSVSGGTDVCSAFVGGSPNVPVWEGEISCRYLGCAVESFDPGGKPVRGEPGELVVTEPMPSMPVRFWGDGDGSRLRAAYFEDFPGVWRHGDWIEITDRGSCVITGRSDATLNRGGIRVGTAELYRVVEALPGIVDSLVVHVDDGAEGPGRLVLFVVPGPGAPEGRDELVATVRDAVRRDLSPRHVPDVVVPVAAIPTTLSGKKLEVPVKRILAGADPDEVASPGSLRDPEALGALVEAGWAALAEARAGRAGRG